MNQWFICWFFAHVLLEILILKELTARSLCTSKSFGVKWLHTVPSFVLDLLFLCYPFYTYSYMWYVSFWSLTTVVSNGRLFWGAEPSPLKKKLPHLNLKLLIEIKVKINKVCAL
jgi:hypothetical protein